VSTDFDYRLAVEEEIRNFSEAMWCLSTASRPYWGDVARMLDMTQPAVCRRHLTDPSRCNRCGRAEGYECFAVEEIATVRADGRCQECLPAQLSLFGRAA